MSWLLVALIPGLLMVATFGLQRIESGLRPDAVSATDVARFLDQAVALERANQRLHEHQTALSSHTTNGMSRDLPERVYVHHGANTGFQRTAHPYRV